MVNFSKICCLPRRVDAHHEKLIKPATLKLYRDSLQAFVSWLETNNHNPTCAPEIDAFIVQFKNEKLITKAKLIFTLAAVEFFFPSLKRELQWARRVADGCQACHATQHTVPATSLVTALFGCTMAAINRPSLGLGHILQQCLGLRPNELLALLKAHVLPPDFANGKYIFRLGAHTGTKSKREQTALLDPERFPLVAQALDRLLAHRDMQDKLFPYSYFQYLDTLQGLCEHFQLSCKITPRSPRAGFATERVAEGEEPSQVQLAGRWASETSFRIYLDTVMASQVTLLLSMQGQREAMQYCKANLDKYFTSAAFRAEHGAERLGEGPRGALRASRVSLPRGSGAKEEAAEGRHTSAAKGSAARAAATSKGAAARAAAAAATASSKGRGGSGASRLQTKKAR